MLSINSKPMKVQHRLHEIFDNGYWAITYLTLHLKTITALVKYLIGSRKERSLAKNKINSKSTLVTLSGRIKSIQK